MLKCSFTSRVLAGRHCIGDILCIFDCLTTIQVVTFRHLVMVLVEKGNKMQVTGLAQQKYSENREHQKAEKQRKKWIGKSNLHLSS